MINKPLSILKYMSSRDSMIDVDKEYKKRIDSPSAALTNLFPLLSSRSESQHNDLPIFFIETFKMAQLNSKIFKNSADILKLSNSLPDIAKNNYISSLLSNEINSSNEIEQVKTNRHDISTIVDSLQSNIIPKQPRLVSTVKKYLGILNEPRITISELKDYRKIYDELTSGEIPQNKLPDGELFRNSSVTIGTSDNSKIVHRPPISENTIKSKLTSLISFMNNDEFPIVEKAIVTHFMFENTHPFYDGNGRMGRYLLTQYLIKKIDTFTALSISKSIQDHEKLYYQSFADADKYENYAELTYFIESMMQIIIYGQETALDKMTELQSMLNSYGQIINAHFANNGVISDVLFIFVQSKLFSIDTPLGIKDTELINMLYRDDSKKYKKNNVKKIINNLENEGFLKLVNGNPIQHEVIMDKIDDLT
ncbi:Fic family protein [Companilactobacillus baiquanensis]|uniref:Fic family protein n=1 Tax=Companilactobacillus baiquanensis TaxID=2486005 RepID=A0ABW1UVV9_9LACO|nr:Fic family protein [Companilactobacillus baiquanensis]